jgi:hypothetical protein
MTTLVLLAHHDPTTLASYRAALAAAGIDLSTIELHPFAEDGLSSIYHALAAHLRDKQGRILPNLVKDRVKASLPLESYERVLIVSWSAPYALMEDLLAVPADAAALTGWVGLDSAYGPVPPAVIAWAKLAREGTKLYSACYTDVQTSGYANSKEFLDQVQREAGAPTGLFTVEHLASNRNVVNDGAYWRAEHERALHQGPRLLVAALQALDARDARDHDEDDDTHAPRSSGILPPPPTEIEPPTVRASSTLRRGSSGPDVVALQRRLKVIGYDLKDDGIFGPATESALKRFQIAHSVGADGAVDKSTRDALDRVFASDIAKTDPPSDDRTTEAGLGPLEHAVIQAAKEDLGIVETSHNDSTEIRALYLDPLHLPPGSEWCAPAFRSWLYRGAAALGITPPIMCSTGAKAMMAQFIAAGLWLSVDEAREHPELVQEGMSPIWDRSVSGKPETAWHGHQGVVTGRVKLGVFATIEGNSGPAGNRVAVMARQLSDPKLLGFGRLSAA